MNEKELREKFNKVRSGDKEAFAGIFEELKKPVFTIASRILKDKSAAEDVTQEVFVKLFVSPPDPSVKNLRAWIFKVARNLSIDALRKPISLSIEETEPAIDDQCENVLYRLDVERAVEKLTLEQRQILTLHINAGLKFKEIALVMDLSQSAVFRRYKKALKTLRSILEVDLL